MDPDSRPFRNRDQYADQQPHADGYLYPFPHLDADE
jgi:hypothetical protein